MHKAKKIIPLFALPIIASAQITAENLIRRIKDILNKDIIPLLMLIATIVFLWGIITYITAAGDEEKIKKGRQYVIWGLLGLFVMVAVWALVRIIAKSFDIDIDQVIIPPGPTI